MKSQLASIAAPIPKIEEFYRRYDKQYSITPDRVFPKVKFRRWLGIAQMIYDINLYVNNAVKYQPEAKGEDKMQTPFETNVYGYGDCEDYAIYKWHLLKKNGIPEEDMKFLVGRYGTELHVILQVKYRGEMYYLDNRDSASLGEMHLDELLFYWSRFGWGVKLKG